MEQEQAKSIISELGFDDLPEDRKNDLLVSLSEALEIRTTERLMGMLTETEKTELEKIISSGKNDEADEYLAAKVPKLEEIMNDEYELYRKELLALNDETKAKLAQQ